MAERPRVAVVIPERDRARLLVEALASVAAQRWTGVETIVVSDGPGEDARPALRGARPEPRWLRLPRRSGPAAARNAAIRASTAPLVAFLDSDDVWTEGKLERQAALFEDPRVVWSFTDFDAVGPSGEILHRNCLSSRTPLFRKWFAWLRRAGFYLPLPRTPTVMVRRSALRKVGLFDEGFRLRHEDVDLWLRLHAAFPRGVRFLRSSLTRCRVHPDRLTAATITAGGGRRLDPSGLEREMLLDDGYFAWKHRVGRQA